MASPGYYQLVWGAADARSVDLSEGRPLGGMRYAPNETRTRSAI